MMDWYLFALISSLAGIGPFLIADYIKIRGFTLTLWTRIFVVLALLPVIFFFPAPSDPFFYVFLSCAGLAYFHYDVAYYDLAMKKGSGLTSRIKPLSIWVTFFLWSIITPSLLLSYIAQPLISTGILFSIGLGVYFALRLKKCEFSWSATVAMAPYMLLSGLGQSFGKLSIDRADEMVSGTIHYVFWTAGFITLMLIGLKTFFPNHTAKYSDEGSSFKTTYLLFGAMNGVILLIAGFSKYFAYWHVENPAYVSVFALLGPFWVLGLKKALGHKEPGDLIAGFGIVLSCILLVFFTRIL